MDYAKKKLKRKMKFYKTEEFPLPKLEGDMSKSVKEAEGPAKEYIDSKQALEKELPLYKSYKSKFGGKGMKGFDESLKSKRDRYKKALYKLKGK